MLAAGAGLADAYVGVVRGDLVLDVGVGRRMRELGPQRVAIAAPRETVFDVIFWAAGAWWGARAAGPWERAVAASLAATKAEAERRAGVS